MLTQVALHTARVDGQACKIETSMSSHASAATQDGERPGKPGESAGRGRLKVVRVIARLNVGGPARHATLLNHGLRVHGIDSLLVHGSLDRAEGSLEGLIDTLGLRARKIPRLGRRISIWSDAAAFLELTRILFEEQPDVVHTHTAKAGTLGRLAAIAYNATRSRGSRCAVIHTFHGHVFSGYFGSIGSAAARVAERGLARLTDRIITISASQREDICSRYRVAPAAQVDVIELGLDLDGLLGLDGGVAARDQFGLNREDVVFGYVGRLAPVKNLPVLMRAFHQAAASEPRARLLLVGDGELRLTLEQLAAELGLADRVRFAGWQRDMAPVYRAIDVGVLASLNEGTPVALIEAMAAGKPVIATAVGGVPDVVAHGRSGLVVPAGDERGLAAAMRRLAREAETRAAFGAAARKDVGARFSRERLQAEISRCYERALRERRGSPPSRPRR
jgi:glycosyltransferase involved in cell wall biosynthesis